MSILGSYQSKLPSVEDWSKRTSVITGSSRYDLTGRAPQPGVRIGVPLTTPLLDGAHQPRQFEYHYTEPYMCVGMTTGEVVLMDWSEKRILGQNLLPGARVDGLEPANVLALTWLHQHSDRMVAACSNGSAAMYRIDSSLIQAEEPDPNDEDAPTPLILHHTYAQPLADKLTSIHCNSDDTLLSASGYTHTVNILDLPTGRPLRRLRNIHAGHINIARFANHMPYLLLTCSFDKKLQMFDIRSNAHVNRASNDFHDPDSYLNSVSTPVPIYTCESMTGNVMVCFSPNDLYFLSSAVDNEVKQYHVVDGRLNLELAIPKMNIQTNYTRSYYMNEGETIISGSSSSDLLHVCSSVDGQVLDTVDMVEGRKDSMLYIQSLRGCPMPEQHNRCTVLICYRNLPATHSFELIDVDMNRSPSGDSREHPLSLSSIIDMADDYHHFLNHSYAADVVISCEGAVGDQLIYAHQAILQSRWPWFAKHVVWSQQTLAPTTTKPDNSAATSTQWPTSHKPASGSLDDEDTHTCDTPMTDSTTAAGLNTSSTSEEPLRFCRIQVPHPQSVLTTTASTSSSSFDTITISSTGMISLDFPHLSRANCLYLLEYLYTGAIPMQSFESALTEARASRDTEEAKQKRISQMARARKDHDFEAMAHLAREEEKAALKEFHSSGSIDDGVKGLDDEDEIEQIAILASISRSQSKATPTTPGLTSSSSYSAPMDIHEALVALSLHATPATAAITVGPAAPPIQPLSAQFEIKARIYELASSSWYDLPRLCNILERAMRKQLRLNRFETELESTSSSTLSTSSTSSSSSVTSSTATSSITPSPSSFRSPGVSLFYERLSTCLRLGAAGLVEVGQDIILRNFDWLQSQHPWFIDQLPNLFPDASSPFLSHLEKQRAKSLKREYKLQLSSISFATIPSSNPNDSSCDLVLWAGGTNSRMIVPLGVLYVLNPETLRVTEISCPNVDGQPPSYDLSLAAHATCAIHDAQGRPSHLLVFSGQQLEAECVNTLRVLDLNTLLWSERPLDLPPRPRKKSTLTNVAHLKRAYMFGGRDRYNVFGEVFYLDYSNPKEWAWVNVHEQLQMQGRANSATPSVRFSHTCNYSATAGGIVLFGGRGIGGNRNDVWLLDTSTNLWECKIQNDPGLLNLSPTAYDKDVQSGRITETSPLPRFGHTATNMVLNGREYLVIFGGVVTFEMGTIALSDLWLLNLTDFTWTKVTPNYDSPRVPPIDLDGDADEEVDVNHVALDSKQVPTRRLEHFAFIKPLNKKAKDTAESKDGSSSSAAAPTISQQSYSRAKLSQGLTSSTATSAASTLKSNIDYFMGRKSASPSPAPSIWTEPCGQLAIIGGIGSRYAVEWVDVFDFQTLKWSRQKAHPSAIQAQPCININDSGCLWQDMQQRFRRTQPEPFASPSVQEDLLAASVTATSSTTSSFSRISTSTVTATSTIDDCIRFNLAREASLFSSPTPLPQCSFIHFLVEGRVITVPKIILTSRCPTFLSMLTSTIRDPQLIEKNLIRIEGVRYIIFRCIVYYLYCGDEEFIIEMKENPIFASPTPLIDSLHLQPPSISQPQQHRLRSSSSSSSASSPVSRGTKRNATDGDPTEASDMDDLSLGALDMQSLDLQRSSSSVKKSKNGHSSPLDASPVPSFSGHDATTLSGPVTVSSIPSVTRLVAYPSNGSELDSIDTIMNDPNLPSIHSSSTSQLIIDPLEVLCAADRFNLSSLCSVLEIGLSRQIDVSVVCKFLYFAEVYHLNMLKQRCTIFIIQHYEEVTSAYATEYAQLADSTREWITSALHVLAGSHRGPTSRNEPNPLVLDSTVPAGADDDAMRVRGGSDDEDDEDDEPDIYEDEDVNEDDEEGTEDYGEDGDEE